jgi:hypothetical protein
MLLNGLLKRLEDKCQVKVDKAVAMLFKGKPVEKVIVLDLHTS